MKLTDIPQDNLEHYQGHKRASYALDSHGAYAIGQSSGWDVEKIVNQLAMDDLSDIEQRVTQQVKDGNLSLLAYYAMKRRMDLPLLATSAGFYQWRVKRHFRPKIFAQLSDRVLLRYANVLNIPIEVLKNGKPS